MSEVTERLDAIKARLGKATRGPWEERCVDYGERPSVWKDEEYAFPIGMCVREDCHAEAVYEKGDAEFIADAPADVAYLLTLARKQAAALEAVRGLHKHARTDVEPWASGFRYSGDHCTHDGEHWPCSTVAALGAGDE